MMPLIYRGETKREAKQKAEAMLDHLEIAQLARSHPNAMSGGQQQRVAIARALVTDPSLILADEPTGALDAKTSKVVMQLLKDLKEKTQKTIIIVTHDPQVGKQCERCVHLHDGEISHES